jgi:hypothetical protein
MLRWSSYTTSAGTAAGSAHASPMCSGGAALMIVPQTGTELSWLVADGKATACVDFASSPQIRGWVRLSTSDPRPENTGGTGAVSGCFGPNDSLPTYCNEANEYWGAEVGLPYGTCIYVQPDVYCAT